MSARAFYNGIRKSSSLRFGEEARAHLYEKLERWGYHVLTAAIKEQFNLSQGKIFAFLPENLSADELTIEALSRICYERNYDIVSSLFKLLQEHLKRDNAVVVVPDVMPTYQELVALAQHEALLPPLLLGFGTRACHAWTSYTEDGRELKAMLGYD